MDIEQHSRRHHQYDGPCNSHGRRDNVVFYPATVSPSTSGTTSILSITTTAATPIANTTMIVTGMAEVQSKTTQFNLDVRSANFLTTPFALAIENGGATALVTESDSLVRVNLATGGIAPVATSLFSRGAWS